MTKKWLVRYSEIFLKSDPVRRQWERVLMNNIRLLMPDLKIQSERGRIWLNGDVQPDMLKNIFGIVSFSEVEHVPHEESLEIALIEYGRAHGIVPGKDVCAPDKTGGKARLFLERQGNRTGRSREEGVPAPQGEPCRSRQGDPRGDPAG